MFSNFKADACLREKLQVAAQPSAYFLDIVKVRVFPDRSSQTPVKDQILADAHAQAVMKAVHVGNQLNHLVVPNIPADALAEADRAYLEGLRRRGGDEAVQIELLRRKEYGHLARQNEVVLDVVTPQEPVWGAATPDMMAKSLTTYVELEADTGPKPTF